MIKSFNYNSNEAISIRLFRKENGNDAVPLFASQSKKKNCSIFFASICFFFCSRHHNLSQYVMYLKFQAFNANLIIYMYNETWTFVSVVLEKRRIFSQNTLELKGSCERSSEKQAMH